MHLTLLEVGLLVITSFAIGLGTAVMVGYSAARLTLRISGKGEGVLSKPTPVGGQAGKALYPSNDDSHIMPDTPPSTPTKAGRKKA